MHLLGQYGIPFIIRCVIPKNVLCDFLGTVKAEPHECVIRTGQP